MVEEWLRSEAKLQSNFAHPIEKTSFKPGFSGNPRGHAMWGRGNIRTRREGPLMRGKPATAANNVAADLPMGLLESHSADRSPGFPLSTDRPELRDDNAPISVTAEAAKIVGGEPLPSAPSEQGSAPKKTRYRGRRSAVSEIRQHQPQGIAVRAVGSRSTDGRGGWLCQRKFRVAFISATWSRGATASWPNAERRLAIDIPGNSKHGHTA